MAESALVVFKRVVKNNTALNALLDSDINPYLDDAKTEANEDYLGERYNRYVAYLAAHYLTMADATAVNNINALVMEKDDDVQYQYARPGDLHGDHFETKYGRIADSIMNTVLHQPIALA